jgi:tetratricopeptide (TPR) repeat protein
VPWKKPPSKRRREIIVPQSAAPQNARPIRAEARATLVASIARGRRWLDEIVRAIEYTEQALAIRREVGDRGGEASDLGNLALFYSQIGQNTRAIDLHQQALQIDREIKNREGEAHDLENLGDGYRLLGRPDEALRYYTDALVIARDIGYRLIEAGLCVDMADLHVSQDNWSEAARDLEQAIEIADGIGAARTSKRARETFALVNVYRNNLAAARELVEVARKYDVPLSNHSSSAMLGVVALRQAELNTAREVFTAAINEASQLIALTADRYDALDVKGLSLCGLALCGDPAQIPAAKTAYSAARAVTSDAGITREVLQWFDALAQADADGILAEVRPIAAGVKPERSVAETKTPSVLTGSGP